MLPGLSSIRHSDGSDWLSSCPIERGKGTDLLALRKAVPPFFACLQPLKGPKMCPEGQLAPSLERCEAAIWFNPSLQKWNAQAINPIFSGRKPATRARWSRDHRPLVTRPAPDGHATSARGSLRISLEKSGKSLEESGKFLEESGKSLEKSGKFLEKTGLEYKPSHKKATNAWGFWPSLHSWQLITISELLLVLLGNTESTEGCELSVGCVTRLPPDRAGSAYPSRPSRGRM